MFELSYGVIALVTFAAIIILILARIPIAMVFFTVGVFGFTFLLPKPMLNQLGPSIWRMLDSFPLTAVVPFVLMGEFMLQGGMSKELYNALEKWIKRLPGGLSQVNVVACAIFAAISGSSVSTAATMGVIAGPEMESRGYDNRLTYGTLAAGGTLGILIPPSITLIIYGALTSTSIGQLFIAGIIPGIIVSVLFMVVTSIWVAYSPKIAPRIEDRISWKDRFMAIRDFLPVGVLILTVLGGIYGGIVTPTEAASIGAVMAFILLVIKGRLSRELIKKSLRSTILISSMSYMILAGSSLINFLFAYTQVPLMISQFVAGLNVPSAFVLFLVCIMYLILGMFIDAISMVVLTVSAIVPLLTSLGYDPVWIGIIIIILAELALITPPVGINLYILLGVSKSASFGEICMGVIPYAGVLLFMLVLLTLFPQLALWLPASM
ncbi:MAG: TRAP transporter large permease [Deltaproteobacteria bacterium]|nr:TRAP transporter large permease [Deltaproteobacteria bacterium]